MAIVVETGAIVTNANSYVSLSEADSYHLDHGNSTWGDTKTKEREAALVRAAAALDSVYNGRWYGVKTNNNTGIVQLRSWPRKEFADKTTALKDVDGVEIGINTIPPAIKNAQLEIALIELTGSFSPNKVDRSASIKRRKTDVLETEWFEGTPTFDLYPGIDFMLKGLTRTGNTDVEISVELSTKELDSLNEQSTESYLEDTRYFL